LAGITNPIMKQIFTILVLAAATLSASGQGEGNAVPKPSTSLIQFTVKCDKAEYMHGEPGVAYIMAPTGQLIAKLTAKNVSDQPQMLEFRSGQKYDLVICDGQGKEVKRWSTGMAFTMAITQQELAAGKELSFTQTLDLGEVRKPMALGSYVLEAILTCHPPLTTRVPFKIIETPVRKP